MTFLPGTDGIHFFGHYADCSGQKKPQIIDGYGGRDSSLGPPSHTCGSDCLSFAPRLKCRAARRIHAGFPILRCYSGSGT